ncbi:uncharacterized protein [Embiotoca jacksoni]|uniref:uncharacterized protein isoform X2 n=1 Tax=Embiotoca jacksoni TaxID=100190 RepID=UPI00370395B9
MSRWKMLLLLSCWIITVMAKDPSATHYRLKSSSVCLRVRKPPPVHSGTWKFGETLFASDKFIKPSHRERVFFSPGNLSLCLNKLTDGDSGIYEVSFYDSNFTSTSETHQVIVQEQVPQPVMEMLVLRSNVSTGFCNITVNCSVRDDWVWFVCDENNCTASGKSFSKVNITVVTDNRTVVCSGNNHVSKSNVSKSKDLCDDDIILVSPVHPATEGSSVILDCKLRTENVLSNVIFYKNDTIIQNDPRGQMTISAVSTTDEGFYKCQYSGKESPQSWMAVKSVSRAESSSSLFHVLLIVGLLCGISLIILLLLFCRYKQSKDSCFIRSQSTSQSSATYHMTNQDEAQCNKCAPPPHVDASLYESIKSPEGAENGAVYSVVRKNESNDVTYSLLELKSITKKGKTKKPEESCVYSDVQIRSSPGKSAHAAADEMVYSEVKPGKSLGNCAVLK